MAMCDQNSFDDLRNDLHQIECKLSLVERDYQSLTSRCIASGMFVNKGSEDVYGWECILDICSCDVLKFNRNDLDRFFEILCRDILKMERHDLHFWDDAEVEDDSELQTDPRKKGTSAVQFIMYSTIVLHCLDELKTVFVNVFSCRPFDEDHVERFACDFFGGSIYTATRKMPRKTFLESQS